MQEPSKTLYAHLPPAWTSAVLDDPNRFITRTNPSPAICAGLRLLGTAAPARPSSPPNVLPTLTSPTSHSMRSSTKQTGQQRRPMSSRPYSAPPWPTPMPPPMDSRPAPTIEKPWSDRVSTRPTQSCGSTYRDHSSCDGLSPEPCAGLSPVRFYRTATPNR